jgi:hypothetical protein
MLDAFTTTPLVVKHEITVEDSIIQSFFNDWEIINDKTVAVRVSELSYLGGKIKNELAMIGVVCKKHKKHDENKDKWCYYGIKRKQITMDKMNEL